MSELTTEIKPLEELKKRLIAIRDQTMALCDPLRTEDFVVQPIIDVSPPKWHLAHTTWFFEHFILSKWAEGYTVFDPNFHFLFNSYYIAAGERWSRADRGNLTRPTVQEVFDYRNYVDEQLQAFLSTCEPDTELLHVLEVGMQHEQQHQELLVYDIKYIFGHNPVFPVYSAEPIQPQKDRLEPEWLPVEEGVYEIGHQSEVYCFDNELGVHKQFLHSFEVGATLITNNEFLEFVNAGGYTNHAYWLSEGWDWVNTEKIKAPMYWFKESGQWLNYTLAGMKAIDWEAPVSHISFYEADAFAKWRGCRLPTEFEWEIAAKQFEPTAGLNANFVGQRQFETVNTGGFDFLGNVWEWTASAYRPYPYYEIPAGALGEYNGKFMSNQMVLRGGSYATPKEHIRHSYRNFFQPHLRWMCSGIRLARHT